MSLLSKRLRYPEYTSGITSIVMNTTKNGRRKRYAARYCLRFAVLVRCFVGGDADGRSTVSASEFDMAAPCFDGMRPGARGRPVPGDAGRGARRRRAPRSDSLDGEALVLRVLDQLVLPGVEGRGDVTLVGDHLA